MIKPSDATMAEIPDVVRDYIFELEQKIGFADKAFNIFRGVLCNPEGYVCIDWPDGDKEESQKAMALLERTIE